MAKTRFSQVVSTFVGNVTGNLTGNVVGNVTGNLTGQHTPSTIADPGDAGAIPVSGSGMVVLESGASPETRTLAAPTFAGQRLVLIAGPDFDSDIVITCASGIGDTGGTFSIVGTQITVNYSPTVVELLAAYEGEDLKWVGLSNDGADISTP